MTTRSPLTDSRSLAREEGAPPVRPLPRAVRRGRVLGGLLLIVVAAAVAGWLFVSAGDRVAVVAVTRDVPVGTVLSAADVTTTRVAAEPGVPTIPAGQAGTVVGRIAAVDLRRGMLLAPSQLTSARTPARGQQIVPVALTSSRLPAGDLRPGDQVLVVPTPGGSGADGGGGGAAADGAAPLAREVPALVDRVGGPDVNGVVVVNLLVGEQVGPQIARQASTGRLALVITARRA